MRRPRSPFALAVAILAGFLTRRQQDAIDYLREENRVLREMLRGRRLRFTDRQRKRLAIRGKALGRALLKGVATLVQPDTILDWRRRLVAKKWTYAGGAQGNAEAMKSITKNVLRMARENPTWGYDKLQGALKNLGHIVCPNTIKAILLRNGIQPAPDRGRRTPWRTFLKAHARSIFAADFFTTEVWTMRGLVTHYTLFVIHHATRAVRIVGTTVPAAAPNYNAIAERFVKSIKDGCLDRMIFFGTDSLLRAVREYETHYVQERPHQAIGNELIDPVLGEPEGTVRRRERLGGLLNYYYRSAA
jgi:putative transposase